MPRRTMLQRSCIREQVLERSRGSRPRFRARKVFFHLHGRTRKDFPCRIASKDTSHVVAGPHGACGPGAPCRGPTREDRSDKVAAA
jgi:hypothetical protein